MSRIATLAATSLLLALIACDSAPVAPVEAAPSDGAPSLAAGSSGWESGVITQILTDVPNACTGELSTFTYTGELKVTERGGFYHLVAHGEVVTSDGWSGKFSTTFVIQDDRVFMVRFHDVELSQTPSGPKQVWSVGMGHQTLAGGVTHDYFEKYGNSGCRGNQ